MDPTPCPTCGGRGKLACETHEANRLVADGWRQGRDKLWRNDRFGGAYKTQNALALIGVARP